MSDEEYQGECALTEAGESDNTQFLLWHLILFVGVIILIIVAWPHLVY
jgi:hypothetical protein